MMRLERRLSVIVPLTGADGFLEHTFLALLLSDLPRDQWELLAVNDGAGEAASLLAARYADIVVRLPGEARGLGYARNRGGEISRGEILVFIDPNVKVRPGCLRALVSALDGDATIGGAVAVPVVTPASTGIVSRLRELRHLQEERQPTEYSLTLWMDCAAVRRAEFMAAGMCDELCRDEPRIEAAELGRRMRLLGHRIARVAAAEMTASRPTSLVGALRAEFRDHGVPWDDPAVSDASPLDGSERAERFRRRLLMALPWGAVVAAGFAVTHGGLAIWIAFALLVLTAFWICAPLYTLFLREEGVRFTVLAVPLHLLLWLATAPAHARRQLLHHTLGAPGADPTTDAFSEVQLTVWPPLPVKQRLERERSSRVGRLLIDSAATSAGHVLPPDGIEVLSRPDLSSV